MKVSAAKLGDALRQDATGSRPAFGRMDRIELELARVMEYKQCVANYCGKQGKSFLCAVCSKPRYCD